jgi:hypothetical protein
VLTLLGLLRWPDAQTKKPREADLEISFVEKLLLYKYLVFHSKISACGCISTDFMIQTSPFRFTAPRVPCANSCDILRRSKHVNRCQSIAAVVIQSVRPTVIPTKTRNLRYSLVHGIESNGHEDNSVLIVNDEPDQLTLMGSLLRKAGYSVLTAEDGVEA